MRQLFDKDEGLGFSGESPRCAVVAWSIVYLRCGRNGFRDFPEGVLFWALVLGWRLCLLLWGCPR